MCASARAWGCAFGLVWVFLCSVGGGVALGGRGNPERGRELFVKVWQAGQSELGGDGLGPMFNEHSCLACHGLSGIGGAGLLQHNVDLLTAVVPSFSGITSAWFDRLRAFHPALSETATSTVLHKFSSDSNYDGFRSEIITRAHKLPTSDRVAEIKTAQGDQFMITQRNTTPLFGAGLIDSVASEEIMKAIVEAQEADANVSGRFVGRFGWRGQVADLYEFVLGACAVELGLNVPGRMQTANPLQFNSNRGTPDMSSEQCEDLVSFVASLPAPRRLRAANSTQETAVRLGASTFAAVGCAACHHPKLGRVDGIYSDLAVHDMGPRLEDPASASTRASARYYGQSEDLNSPLAEERRREWKTPPLWGVRDSAPYLHDGRAATIEEAVLWHGGEAASSLERYSALPASERNRVLLFLSTMAGPDPALLARYAVSER